MITNESHSKKSNLQDIHILANCDQTVFTIREIATLWNIANIGYLKIKLNRYVRYAILINLRRGLYSLSDKIDLFELASKMHSPSYVSFETILYKESIVFQCNSAVISASNYSKQISCKGTSFEYKKINLKILYNPKGVIVKENYSIASIERAFLDYLYLYPNSYVDNLAPIPWDKCFDLVDIYENKSLIKRLDQRYKMSKE